VPGPPRGTAGGDGDGGFGPGVTGNSRTPSSPPMESSAAATCTSAWVSTPPVMARSLSDGHCHPFLWLRDGTHRWPPTCEPRPFAQARQIRPASPVSARKPGTRPTGRCQDSPRRRRPIRRSGRDPGPGPTPAPGQNHAGTAGSGEARPEALSTSSLPNMYAFLRSRPRYSLRTYQRIWCPLGRRRSVAGARGAAAGGSWRQASECPGCAAHVWRRGRRDHRSGRER
jgi:hypothetical protein